MTTDPYMGFVYPTVGGSSGLWGGLINTALQVLGLHDHRAGSGNPIRSAALLFDADVSISSSGSFFAILEARALGMRPQIAATMAGLLNVFYVASDASNNLYFKNQAGQLVRITNGNALDQTAIGGIVEDYATAGAEVAFVAADDCYTFKQEGSPRPWAAMKSGEHFIYQTAANITEYVALKSPAALAARYEITLPAALPASQVFLQMTSAGVLVASNTIPTAIKQGYTRTFSTPASMASPDTLRDAAGNRFTVGVSTARIVFPMPIQYNNAGVTRITRWSLRVFAGSLAGTITARLYSYNAVTGAETGLGTAKTINATGVGATSLTGSALTVDTQPADHDQFYVAFTGGGTTGDFVYHLEWDLVDQ